MRVNFTAFLTTILLCFALELRAQQPVIRVNSSLGTPAYIEFAKGEEPLFQDWKVVLPKLLKTGSQTDWKIYSQISDQVGQTHYRIQQYYQGIPLENGVGIIHTFNGKIISLNGEFIPEGKLEGRTIISNQSAREFALKHSPAEEYYWQNEEQNKILQNLTGNRDTSWFPQGKLVYCPLNLNYQNTHRLVFKFEIYAIKPLFGTAIYVDAENGGIIATESLILHTDVKGSAATAFSGTREITTYSTAPGSYRLREAARGKGIETLNMQKGTSYGSAVDFTDANNIWSNVNANKDEVATDAHWGAEKTYDYYDTILGRKSFDNNNAKILSYVHYSTNYANAFWNGAYMTYGDGNGSTWKPLTSIDVCGHEISHAVTTYTANLVYSYESGALNESFSDIFGNAIERWARPNKYSWKIGEDFTTSGGGIRDMSNPNPFANPKYYKGVSWYAGTSDNGGVHTNSGVQNYWFYLITDGVKGVNEKSQSFKIDSLGVTDASRIAYRNLSVYLTKNSQYSDARIYSIKAAADLFGQCSKHVVAVTNAWWACGVGSPYDSAFAKADFFGDTVACKRSDIVKFTNLSTNYKSCTWYFGDGKTSSVFNPSHSYGSNGKFTVKLVVQSCYKNSKDSLTRINYVKVDSTFDICEGVLMPTSGIDSAYKCKGFIYDDGGEGNYGALKQIALKLIIPGADSVRLRFLVLDYEKGFDSVVLFKTDTKQVNKIGKFTGNTLPFGGSWITVKTGVLWLIQYSDPLVEGKGFKIQFEGKRKPITLDLGLDSTICMGDTVLVVPQVGNGYSPDLLYRWNTGAFTPDIVVKPTSALRVALKLTDACTNVTVADSMMVYVRQPLKITLGKDTTICSGNTVKLSSIAAGGLSSAYVYSWDNSLGGASSHVVKPSVTTKYSVILSDGCTNLDDTTYQIINVKPPLNVKINASGTHFCIGKTANLTANASGGDTLKYKYTWNNSLGIGKNKNPVINDTTFFKVTLTDACSVLPASDSLILFSYPPLQIQKPKDTIICIGSLVSLKVSGKGGIGSGFNFKWNTGENVASITKTPITPTYYIVKLSDACSPDVKDSIFVDYLQPLNIAPVRDTTLCDGQNLKVPLKLSGGLPKSYAVSWNTPTVNGASPTITPPTGNNNYLAILTDGCTSKSDSVSFNITMLSPLKAQIQAAPTSICFGDSTLLTFSFSGGKSSNYNWLLDGSGVKFMSKKVMPSSTTSYVLTLNDGCSTPATSNTSVTINQAASAVLMVDRKQICENESVNYSYTSPDAAKLVWYFSTGDSAQSTGSAINKSMGLSGKYTAKAKVTTSNGCIGWFNASDTVEVFPYPKAGFTADPLLTDIQNTLINFYDKSSGATNYNWSFGDGNTSTSSGNQSQSYPVDTGTYLVTQIVSSGPGCTDKFELYIVVQDIYRLFLPNVFTPDNNIVNDIYLPYGTGIAEYQFEIFNRWGEKVFAGNKSGKGWDGKSENGLECEPGVYVIKISLIDNQGFRHLEKGTIVLMR